MRLEQLEIYLSIADTGSISAAARRTFLPQSTVTSILQQLERELGATLVVRRRGQHTAMQLTSSGQLFYDFAQNVLRQYEQLCMKLHPLPETGQQAGVRIVVGQTLSVGIIPIILKELQKKAPEIHAQIILRSTGDTELVKQYLLENRRLFALSIAPIESSAFISELVMRDPLVLIANHSLNVSDKITVFQLQHLPLVYRESHSATMNFLENALEKYGLSTQNLSPVMSVHGATAVREAVKGGAFCGFVPLSIAVGTDNFRYYHIVQIEGIESCRSLYLCRRKDIAMTPEMALFRRFILGSEWRIALTF